MPSNASSTYLATAPALDFDVCREWDRRLHWTSPEVEIAPGILWWPGEQGYSSVLVLDPVAESCTRRILVVSDFDRRTSYLQSRGFTIGPVAVLPDSRRMVQYYDTRRNPMGLVEPGAAPLETLVIF